jgi:hypothetical protein
VDGDTRELGAASFDFTGVDPDANVEADLAGGKVQLDDTRGLRRASGLLDAQMGVPIIVTFVPVAVLIEPTFCEGRQRDRQRRQSDRRVELRRADPRGVRRRSLDPQT